MEAGAAIVFGVLALGVFGFQLALAGGAPWGEYAMGGKYPGRFPVPMRVAAVTQALILAFVALTVLAVADVVAVPWATPRWTVWLIAGVLAIGLVLNVITPSVRERRIWAPVVGLMLVCSLVVAFA